MYRTASGHSDLCAIPGELNRTGRRVACTCDAGRSSAMGPFVRGTIDPAQVEKSARDARVYAITQGLGEAEADRLAQLARDEVSNGTYYLNDRYQVVTRDVDVPDWPALTWLSIKRLDKAPIHDWRELQQIKNMIVGPEHEAVELYPAESRLVDTANQYHLWVLRTPLCWFPFGFDKRAVSEVSIGSSVQRPFARPGA